MVQQFTATKFMSVRDKALTLRAWETFLKHGLQDQHFTARLYYHLIQHCGFIAHCDRTGFYGHYFTDPQMTVKFVSQFDHDKGHWATEIGADYWYTGEYNDINQAMCDVIEQHKADIYASCRSAEFRQDMATVTALMAKHSVGNVLAVEGGYRFS